MAESKQNAGAAGSGDEQETETKKKGLLVPLLIGLGAALPLGGGAAYAVMSGLIPLGDEVVAEGSEKGAETAMKTPDSEPPVFVAFEPLTVTLTQSGAPRQLRLALSVETTAESAERIEAMKPRMLDALNSLLRAMDERELTEPVGMDRLRAQMLRRVQIASDSSQAVSDLLITEFVVF
ncbi:MAG: flagellar basal body-associated FliL family protein [Pseudomonadota bacterium]